MIRVGEFRPSMRPGYGLSRRGLGRPVGVYPNRYGTPQLTLWHWTCRLDCWAAMTSGWYLPDREAALREGLEHLYAYHYPEPCMVVPCDGPHSWWPEFGQDPRILGRGYFTDLRVWLPVTPLLNTPVTQSNAS